MSNHYCVKLSKDTFSCIIFKNRFTDLMYHSTLDFNTIEELSLFLKSKNNLNISLFETDLAKTEIIVQNTITNNSLIKELIESKFIKEKEDIANISFIFDKIKEDGNIDTIKYNAFGLYTNSELYLKSLTLLSDINSNNLTSEVFTLYSISKIINTDKTFLSIYLSNGCLTVIAGDIDNIYFTRSKYLTNNYDIENISEEKNKDYLVDEIIKNILYAKERLRDITFDIVTINGDIYNNNDVFTLVKDQIGIDVESLKPNNKRFKGFSPEQFNKYLIEISIINLDKRFDFTPDYFKTKKLSNLLLNFYIPFLILLVGYFGYESYMKYQEYSDNKSEYTQVSKKIVNQISHLTLDKKSIINIELFVKTVDKSNGYDMLNYFHSIDNTIEKIKKQDMKLKLKLDFKNFIWTNNNTKIVISETKKFDKLLDFNIFINKIKKLKKDLEKDVDISIKSDPRSLVIELSFNFNWKKK